MLTGFAVNISTYWAIKATSGLTFKVLGSVKNTLVVVMGMLLYGEQVSGAQFLCYMVSVAGFILFSIAKSRGDSMVKHKAA